MISITFTIQDDLSQLDKTLSKEKHPIAPKTIGRQNTVVYTGFQKMVLMAGCIIIRHHQTRNLISMFCILQFSH